MSSEPSEAAPHVLLLIANDVTADTRVLKYAASLSSFGLRVTVLGITAEKERSESVVGGARVIREPVPWRIRDYHRRRGLRGLLGRARPGYASRDDATVAKLEHALRTRELRAERGRLLVAEDQGRTIEGRAAQIGRLRRALWWRYLKVRRFWIYVREGLLNRRLRRHSKLRGQAREVLLSFYVALPFLARWRRVVPEIEDYEACLGWIVDELRPDLIHPHDVYLIGVAERAVARARLEGRRIPWVYDAREYVRGLAIPPARIVAAYRDLERESIRGADRVITVSEPIAAELQRAHRLPRKPDLVLNAPVIGELDEARHVEGAPSVRAAAGLPDGVPLLLYSGGLAHPRGVHTVVEALPKLPGVHLAVVSRGVSSYTVHLERLAAKLEVSDRMHLVPFVDPDQVVAYLTSATIGVIPLLHAGNHDWALTNKFFEYAQAGLPILTSDTEVQEELVRKHGIGDVFVAGDPESCAAAVTRMLADLPRLRRPLLEDVALMHEFSWDAQAEVLHEVYSDLLGPLPDQAPGFLRRRVTSLTEIGGHVPASAVAEGRIVLGVGPTNSAGQGWAWAKALQSRCPEVETEVFTLGKISAFVFPTDVRIAPEDWRASDWQLRQVDRVRRRYSHVLLESGLGIFGTLNGGYTQGDLDQLRIAGIKAAVVFHGSEVRSPRIHRELEATSPFRDTSWDLAQKLQVNVDRNLAMAAAFDGPVYVSTPDQLDYVPNGTWLPVVVDLDLWSPGKPVLERERPVLVHVPSSPRLKGSDVFDPIGRRLHDAGLVEYRRAENVPVDEMPALVRDADIMFDQFGLGLYGVQACQAMATERLVLSYVGDRLRAKVPAEIPIVEVTPQTLEARLRELLADRDAARAQAAKGREFVGRFHDGTLAAEVLAEFVGAETTVSRTGTRS